MTATNHVLTGMLVGATISNPLLALPAAFLMHFVLDSLPHGSVDGHKSKVFLYVLSADMGAALAMLLVIFVLQPNDWLLIIISGILCASPDLMWLPGWINEIRGKKSKPMGFIKRFHARIQWAEVANTWGWSAELVWLCLMITLLSQKLIL